MPVAPSLSRIGSRVDDGMARGVAEPAAPVGPDRLRTRLAVGVM